MSGSVDAVKATVKLQMVDAEAGKPGVRAYHFGTVATARAWNVKQAEVA